MKLKCEGSYPSPITLVQYSMKSAPLTFIVILYVGGGGEGGT